MADLIELDVVVRQKGLKESLSTVERLERQLTNAAKAIEQNRISQERYNKILLSAKREYEALGMSSQRATASVRKFADAQREAAQNVSMATVAIKGNVQAQMAATKGSNQFGVVTQQAGYQVSDFIVQVQSGTNAFVAFGQQASQLVGVLPLIASPLGLTAGAAVALSAGLGIAIPLVTAIGAAFTRSAKDAKDAADGLKTYEEALEGLSKKADELRNKRFSLTTEFDEDVLIASEKRLQLADLIAQKQIELEGKSGKDLEIRQNLIKTLEEQLEKESEIVRNAIERVRKEEERLQKAKEAAEWEAGAEERRLAFLERRGGFLEYFNAQIEANAKAEEEALAKAEKLEKGRAKATKDRFNALMKSIAANDAANARAEQQQARVNQSAEEQLKLLEQQNAVIERQITFGKDSREAERLKGKHILENLRSSLEKKGVDEEIILALIEQQKLLLSNKTILGDQVEEAKKLKEALTPVTAQYLLDKGVLPPQAAKDFETVNKAEEEFLSDKRASARKGAEEQAKKYAKALEEQKRAAEELADKIQELEDAADPFREYNRELKDLDKLLKAGKISQQAYNKAVDDLNEGLGESIRVIGDVEQAFSDWMSRGFRDFKSFVGDILNSFKQMLVDMAAAAIRNKIIIPIVGSATLGAGSAAAATSAAAGGGFGTTLGATIAAGASSLGMGASAALGIGGFTSAGVFNVGANAAVATAAGASPVLATIGAALPVIAAVALVVGLLTKKTKILDSGLRATVEGFDVAIETFQLTQSSRLFGLLKGRKKTSYEAAAAEIADPLIESINKMQKSIIDAAGTLGIGSGLFENFSYQFKVSLKGLTEEEQLQKINEEITKMGDSFASLSGHFETMNELLQVAQQRYELDARLLGLLNDQSALLTRQREIERASVHELNQGTLDQIYALEDAYRGVGTAFATVQRSIEARKKTITNSFNEIIESIQSKVQAASQAVGISQSILSSLQSAAGRGIGMSREAGLSYLRSLTGQARITDQEALSEALSAVGEPTEDLYSSFVDYQREFADQSNLIRELEEKAGKQLSADEKILKQLQDQEISTRERYESQIENLDNQLEKAQAQLDALNNIDNSVKSVSTAMSELAAAIKGAQAAQQTAKASSAAAGGGLAQHGGDVGLLDKYDVGKDYTKAGKTYDYIKLQGANQLIDAAKSLGIQTAGKLGKEIQQEISNAGYLAVNLDNATRAQQFALGGYHSGGLRMVGERGPELEATGPSRVYSANQTRRMMQNPDLVEAVKSMKEEIVELRNEQRQLGINNNKYTKRTYDLYRQWDTEGLPAERT